MFLNQRKLAWLGVIGLLLLSLSACTMPLPTPSIIVTAKRNADFSKQLMAAITQHNYEKMQQMMGDKFVWGSWGGDRNALPPAVALVQARNHFFTQLSPVAFAPNKDLTPLLGAQNPLRSWTGNVRPTAAIYTTGLGNGGKDEAILLIAQKPDGASYWYGLLTAPGGFAQQPVAKAQTAVLPPKIAAPVARTAILTAKSTISSTATTVISTTQNVDAQRIEFVDGAFSHDLHAHLATNSTAKYVLSAKAGQVMQVAIVSPHKNVFLSVMGVMDGVTYKAAINKAETWRGVLPSNQEYMIKASTTGGATDYNLHVVVK